MGLTLYAEKCKSEITWATRNGEKFIDKIEAKLYVKCTEVRQWRSTSFDRKNWLLCCKCLDEDAEEVRMYDVVSFLVVGDSKTRSHVANTMVCKTGVVEYVTVYLYNVLVAYSFAVV
jgi:hypothetical protein